MVVKWSLQSLRELSNGSRSCLLLRQLPLCLLHAPIGGVCAQRAHGVHITGGIRGFLLPLAIFLPARPSHSNRACTPSCLSVKTHNPRPRLGCTGGHARPPLHGAHALTSPPRPGGGGPVLAAAIPPGSGMPGAAAGGPSPPGPGSTGAPTAHGRGTRQAGGGCGTGPWAPHGGRGDPSVLDANYPPN